MIRFVALAASALALTFTAPVSGALQLYTKDAVDDLDMYELRGPPLRRLLQGALPVMDMGVGVGGVRIDAVTDTDIGVDAVASLERCSASVDVVMSQGQGTPRACRVRARAPLLLASPHTQAVTAHTLSHVALSMLKCRSRSAPHSASERCVGRRCARVRIQVPSSSADGHGSTDIYRYR